MEIKFKNGSYIKAIPAQETYKSTYEFRTMSTKRFLERYGIKLKWDQKVYLLFYDLRNRFDKRFRPANYLFRALRDGFYEFR